jgi:hypothetical protein
MSTRRVNARAGSCDGKMQVHRDGQSRAAAKMVVSVPLALGEVLLFTCVVTHSLTHSLTHS